MNRVKRCIAIMSPILLIFVLVLVGGNWLTNQAQAQTGAEPASQERTVSVTGRGRVSARPDTAIVRTGVQTQADTAVAALEENNTLMQALISATLEADIAEDDIQTEVVQLFPVYGNGQNTTQPPQVTGYQARNIVEVTIRDLDSLGTLLDSMVEAGGNTIEDIRFEISDTQALLTQAREAAMNDAQATAELLVSLAGGELGQVLTISESSFTPGPPIPVVERVEADVAILPGAQMVEATVLVTWEIR
jgi:uncharacterized protein YggE